MLKEIVPRERRIKNFFLGARAILIESFAFKRRKFRDRRRRATFTPRRSTQLIIAIARALLAIELRAARLFSSCANCRALARSRKPTALRRYRDCCRSRALINVSTTLKNVDDDSGGDYRRSR